MWSVAASKNHSLTAWFSRGRARRRGSCVVCLSVVGKCVVLIVLLLSVPPACPPKSMLDGGQPTAAWFSPPRGWLWVAVAVAVACLLDGWTSSSSVLPARFLFVLRPSWGTPPHPTQCALVSPLAVSCSVLVAVSPSCWPLCQQMQTLCACF